MVLHALVARYLSIILVRDFRVMLTNYLASPEDMTFVGFQKTGKTLTLLRRVMFKSVIK